MKCRGRNDDEKTSGKEILGEDLSRHGRRQVRNRVPRRVRGRTQGRHTQVVVCHVSAESVRSETSHPSPTETLGVITNTPYRRFTWVWKSKHGEDLHCIAKWLTSFFGGYKGKKSLHTMIDFSVTGAWRETGIPIQHIQIYHCVKLTQWEVPRKFWLLCDQILMLEFRLLPGHSRVLCKTITFHELPIFTYSYGQ